jgi:hypothetical protein
MGDLEIKLIAAGSNTWTVLDPNGTVLVGPVDWETAIDQAVRRVALSGGGNVTCRDENGAARSVRQVPVTAPAGPDEPADGEDERVDHVAGTLDVLTGRASGESPGITDRIADFDVGRILGPVVGDKVKVFNRNVSAAAAVGAAAAFIFGSGTLSAVTAPASKAFAGRATVGSYITVGQAFAFALALSISSAITVVLVRGRHVTGIGAFSVVAIVIFVVVFVTYQLGISGPTPDAVAAAAAKATNPPALVYNELRAFLAFYGPIPFISGLAAGLCAGNIVHASIKRDS